MHAVGETEMVSDGPGAGGAGAAGAAGCGRGPRPRSTARRRRRSNSSGLPCGLILEQYTRATLMSIIYAHVNNRRLRLCSHVGRDGVDSVLLPGVLRRLGHHLVLVLALDDDGAAWHQLAALQHFCHSLDSSWIGC